MDEKTIDTIVWWIPFKKTRNSIREFLYSMMNINLRLDNLDRVCQDKSDLDKMLDQKINTAFMHQKTFLPFKNIHNTKDIVIVATGPTAKYYKPIKDAIHIGVNAAFKIEGVKLDYLFLQDFRDPTPSYIEDANKLDCIKFYGVSDAEDETLIPQQYIIETNALQYRFHFPPTVPIYISTQSLLCYGTVVVSALQFALYTNPKSIYLIGCDCNTEGYVFKQLKGANSLGFDDVKFGYEIISAFQKMHYPKTDIIHTNPVGLKGVFTDFYTDEYINSMINVYEKEFEDETNIKDFLETNRDERMDANRVDIFDSKRCDFHIDRYICASQYVKDKTVLDIASGLGYGASYLYNNGNAKKVLGVDIEITAISYARKVYSNKDIVFKHGSILDIPFDNDIFDVVTSFETVEHVYNEDKQMQEVKRVLKTNGHYILSTHNNWGLSKHHVKDYNYFSIKELVEKYFTIEKIYNQNSESNRICKRQIIETTDVNYEEAECFIVVAVNNKN